MVHRVATSKSPTGPFIKKEKPVFTVPGEKFPAEDPFIWVQDGTYWAIVKDINGHFTHAGKSLALFSSDDGLQWHLASNPLVSRKQVDWQGRGVQEVSRLDRPQVWFENGRPAVLFCAIVETKDYSSSYNVHIPLQDKR